MSDNLIQFPRVRVRKTPDPAPSCPVCGSVYTVYFYNFSDGEGNGMERECPKCDRDIRLVRPDEDVQP
jgi:hypothetical protein